MVGPDLIGSTTGQSRSEQILGQAVGCAGVTMGPEVGLAVDLALALQLAASEWEHPKKFRWVYRRRYSRLTIDRNPNGTILNESKVCFTDSMASVLLELVRNRN